MDLQTVTTLSHNLELIRKQLELLDFWRKWPEIKSITVAHMYEYDLRAGVSSCHYMNGIEFVSFEAKRELTLRCLSNSFLKEEVGKKDFIDVDPSDWDEVLEFTMLTCLENRNRTYEKPKDVETEVKVLQEKAQDEFLKHLKGMYLYPIVEPTWNYIEEEDQLYLGLTQVLKIYTSYSEAFKAVEKQNLVKAIHLDIEKIENHGRVGLTNPDNTWSPDEKLEYWKKEAPEFLTNIAVAVVR